MAKRVRHTTGRVVRVNARSEDMLRDLEARALKVNGKMPKRSETLLACIEAFHELVTGKLTLAEVPRTEYVIRKIVMRALVAIAKRLPQMVLDATGCKVAVEVLDDGGLRIVPISKLSESEMRPTDLQLEMQEDREYMVSAN